MQSETAYFDAIFPAQMQLGLTMQDAILSFSFNVGDVNSVYKTPVAVIVSSQFQMSIQPGDVIVSINNVSTINLPDPQGDTNKLPRFVASRIINEQMAIKRTVRLLRFRDPISVLMNGAVVRFENTDHMIRGENTTNQMVMPPSPMMTGPNQMLSGGQRGDVGGMGGVPMQQPWPNMMMGPGPGGAMGGGGLGTMMGQHAPMSGGMNIQQQQQQQHYQQLQQQHQQQHLQQQHQQQQQQQQQYHQQQLQQQQLQQHSMMFAGQGPGPMPGNPMAGSPMPMGPNEMMWNQAAGQMGRPMPMPQQGQMPQNPPMMGGPNPNQGGAGPMGSHPPPSEDSVKWGPPRTEPRPWW